jgi:hypothetical protein
MTTLKAAFLCLVCAVSGTAMAATDGVYSGTSSQGFTIEFTVSGGGTIISSVSLTSDYTCSFGNQVIGLGYNPGTTINGNNFFVQTGYQSGLGIFAGVDFVTLMRGSFAGDTATGTLSQLRSVFRGAGTQTEACRASGQTWTATLIGPANAGSDQAPGMRIDAQPVRLNR